MKILLVYPEFPVTFWSFKHALKFVSKKAVAPPLGLLTVAALLLRQYQPAAHKLPPIKLNEVGALFKSIIRLGIIGRERIQYWKLFFWSIFRRPRLFPLAVTFAIYGFHFRKIIEGY